MKWSLLIASISGKNMKPMKNSDKIRTNKTSYTIFHSKECRSVTTV